MSVTQGSPVIGMTPTTTVTTELALMPPTAVTLAKTVTENTSMMSTTAVTPETAVCPQSFAEIHEKSFKWQNFILLILSVSLT
jgi:hypothetical protein